MTDYNEQKWTEVKYQYFIRDLTGRLFINAKDNNSPKWTELN